MIRAANEVGIKAKIVRRRPRGTRYASIQQQLGPQLIRRHQLDFWHPAKTLVSRESMNFLKIYQARRQGRGDPLGFYLPPFAYADLQVMGRRSKPAEGLDQGKLADWLRRSTRSRRSSATSSTAPTAESGGGPYVLMVQLPRCAGQRP